MDAGLARRIERNVDRGASALLAGAVAFAASTWLAATAPPALRGAETGALAALAFLLCVRALSLVRPKRPLYPVPIFDLRGIDLDQSEELLLTDADRAGSTTEAEPAEEPLILDDVLAEIGPDSRVVRLFDPAAMPTPGQLNDRIERHLGGDVRAAGPEDASQALHAALAELRRSLG